ncbi:hypothetical protein AGMMS49995_11040 [Endomicrobiia bacterium]|nr:hypothetical protein AGMMS49995_11040 [Endomicrobiia bacterium]
MPTYDLLIKNDPTDAGSYISSSMNYTSSNDEPTKIIQVSKMAENAGYVEIKFSSDGETWITGERIDKQTGNYVPMIFDSDDQIEVRASSTLTRAIYTGVKSEFYNTIVVTIN